MLRVNAVWITECPRVDSQTDSDTVPSAFAQTTMNFPETHWSALAVATVNGETAGREALESLCRSYWNPVRDFIVFRGFREAEADDLTQSFLVRLCERSVWRRADAGRGRFRSFLLGALNHFLADELDRRRTAKRGGGAEHVPLHQAGLAPPALTADDEAHFDREWAMAILADALNEVKTAGNWCDGEFEVLRRFLPGAGDPLSLEEGAARTGCGLAAMKSQVHRLRGRFRAAVQQRVAVTVSAPHEIDAEIRHLGRVLMDRATPL